MSETKAPEPRRSLKCGLGFHRWIGRRRANGERFTECERCGKWDDFSSTDDTHWSMGAGG
jgi:hypothetical protein